MDDAGPQRPEPPLRLAARVDPRDHARAWVESDALAALVRASGGEPPKPGDGLLATLDRLDAFSERWDQRAGQERNQAAARADATMSDAAIEDAVTALGQLDLRLPSQTTFDHVVVLGGLVRACITRPAFTAQLLRDRGVRAREVTFLGAFRPLNANEVRLAEDVLGEVPADEIDAMQVGVWRAFASPGPLVVRGEQHRATFSSWEVRELAASGDDPLLRVVAAPSPDPTRRARTPDTLRWFGATFGLPVGASVLVVTTEIYRHYHLVDAVRVLGLGHGAIVDCVGMQPGDVVAALDHQFAGSHRLQEVRSSIRALRALVAALDGS